MKKIIMFLLELMFGVIFLSSFQASVVAASNDTLDFSIDYTDTEKINSAELENTSYTTFGESEYIFDETAHRLYRTNEGIIEPVIPDYSVFGIYEVNNSLYASALNREGDPEVVLIESNDAEKRELKSALLLTNESTIYNFLTNSMGLNKAAACGILANIYCESGFNPNALGDGGNSYGICQWNLSRYTNLKNYCNNHGYDYTTITGQLWFLKYELENSYKSILNYMTAVSNDSTGAYNAGYYWCYNFERPANKETKSVDRGILAKNTYWPKYNSGSTSITRPEITTPTSNGYYGEDITIKWNIVPKAVSYQVLIKDVSDNLNEVVSTTVPSTSFVFNGNFYKVGHKYRVGIAANISGSSEPIWSANSIDFNVIGRPVLSQPSAGSYYGGGISVKWDSVKGANDYRILVKDIDDNSKVTFDKQVGDVRSFTLDGNHYVPGHRHKIGIAALAGGNSGEIWATNSIDFNVIARPVIKQPVDGSSYNVPIKWTSVEGANNYRLIVKDMDDNEKVKFDQTVGNVTSHSLLGSYLYPTHKHRVGIAAIAKANSGEIWTFQSIDFFYSPNSGQLQFSQQGYSITENDGSATITVTRTGDSNGAVSVKYATSNGSAIAVSDYTSTSGTLNFASGETSKTFEVTIINDSSSEGDETVNLTLSSPTGGATLGGTSTAVLTIIDASPANVPVVSVALDKHTLQYEEGDSGVILTATINPSNATNKTIIWTSSDTSVARVEDNGNGTAVVTPVREGSATITVTSVDGNKQDDCSVKVEPTTDQRVTVTVGKNSGTPGSEIMIPVEVEDVSNMAGAQFTLQYDPNIAVVTKIEKGELVDDFGFTTNLSKNDTGTVSIAMSGSEGVNGTGKVAQVTFKLSSSSGGRTTIAIKDLQINDVNAKSIPVNGVDGELQIIDTIYGDLNGDGKITAADATMVLRAAVGLIELDQGLEIVADVNRDGKISAADATLILRYAVGLIDKF